MGYTEFSMEMLEIIAFHSPEKYWQQEAVLKLDTLDGIVGLAGAAISQTVNTMAGPILGHAILFAIGVILLVFGHGLNMVLNLLSVLVHGVRLNTLEFSSHLGMSWSGIKYNPFSEDGNK